MKLSQVVCRHCLVFPLILMAFTNKSNAGQYKTAYAYDTLFPTYYQNNSERPDRVVWIDNRLEEKQLKESLIPVTPIKNPSHWIKKVHTMEHIKGIRSIPVDTAMGATRSIGEIADLAVAYILGALDLIMQGTVNNAFANIRPPGHHVVNGGYTSGFCAYSNVVIAAEYARKVYNIDRILIVDWDYHYGNSTETFFCEDTNIFLAEFGSYSDEPEACNKNKRHIKTYDVKDGNNKDFERIFTDSIMYEMLSFKPELILISCGFDLKDRDGLGSFHVTAKGISTLTKILMEIADQHSNRRILSILEGGYHDEGSLPSTWKGLSQCAENHIHTFMTREIAPETDFFETIPLHYRKNKRSAKPAGTTNSLFTISGQKVNTLDTFGNKRDRPAAMNIGISSKQVPVLIPNLK